MPNIHIKIKRLKIYRIKRDCKAIPSLKIARTE